MPNDSKQAMPINEENAQRLADHLATVGPFVQQRAAELGLRWTASWTSIRRGSEWGGGR